MGGLRKMSDYDKYISALRKIVGDRIADRIDELRNETKRRIVKYE